MSNLPSVLWRAFVGKMFRADCDIYLVICLFESDACPTNSLKPVWKVSWLKCGEKCVQYGSPGWAIAARGQMHGWGVLRKTTGSLTSISTQWDTRHAWHTHVKDRSAFEPQGIWKLCVVVHTVQAGIYTIYPYLQPYSDLNYNSVNRLRAPHILRLTTKGRSHWCAMHWCACKHSDDKFGCGPQIFWALSGWCDRHPASSVWRVHPSNRRRNEPAGLPCSRGFLWAGLKRMATWKQYSKRWVHFSNMRRNEPAEWTHSLVQGFYGWEGDGHVDEITKRWTW